MEALHVANIIIGTLEVDGPGEVFRLTSEMQECVNYSTICKLFDRSLFLLWPEGIFLYGILLFLTDAALYNLKADA
jgi:hypothetical protein